MQIIYDIFDHVFFAPIVNLLIGILHTLDSYNISGSLGFSIIILTIFIRVLIWPLMSSQLKSAKKMTELKPHLDHLKAKHKEDKQALAAAQMALYKEHGINPAGGCLPILVQFPIIIALYQSILALFSGDLAKLNRFLYVDSWKLTASPGMNFFGLSLGAKPTEFFATNIIVALAVPAVTAGLTLLQSKMMVYKSVNRVPSEKVTKTGAQTEDYSQIMQTQMLYMMPAMIGFFSFQFPIGLAIYWNTFTLLGILQQYLISGWGGLENWFKLIRR